MPASLAICFASAKDNANAAVPKTTGLSKFPSLS